MLKLFFIALMINMVAIGCGDSPIDSDVDSGIFIENVTKVGSPTTELPEDTGQLTGKAIVEGYLADNPVWKTNLASEIVVVTFELEPGMIKFTPPQFLAEISIEFVIDYY